jgi:hypothetical protein
MYHPSKLNNFTLPHSRGFMDVEMTSSEGGLCPKFQNFFWWWANQRGSLWKKHKTKFWYAWQLIKLMNMNHNRYPSSCKELVSKMVMWTKVGMKFLLKQWGGVTHPQDAPKIFLSSTTICLISFAEKTKVWACIVHRWDKDSDLYILAC